MKKIQIAFFLITITFSCFSQTKRTSSKVKEVVKQDTIAKKKRLTIDPFDVHFVDISGTAVIIGDSIQLLDNDLKTIEYINEGVIVELLGETARLHNYYDGPCDGFKFVKIKHNDSEFLINGRNIYKLKDLVLDLNHTKIFKTRYFAQEVIHGEGFEFCDQNISPVIIVDSNSNYTGLVNIIKDDIYYKINDNHDDVDFFQLGANNVYDRITESEITDEGILINIKRSSLKTIKNYKVQLTKNENGFIAQYLE